MAEPQHPWVEQNLREGVYNLADENIRYLYNNWVPLLGTSEDRERAIRGRLAVEARLAAKFSRVLEEGCDRQRRLLLAGLTQYPLRRADIYDPNADHSRVAPPIYNRIGNDIEQSVFFGSDNDRFARALLPLFDSSDPEIRRLAGRASLLCRKVTFPGVNGVAGNPGREHDALLELLRREKPEDGELLKAFMGPVRRPRRPARFGTTRPPGTKSRTRPISAPMCSRS